MFFLERNIPHQLIISKKLSFTLLEMKGSRWIPRQLAESGQNQENGGAVGMRGRCSHMQVGFPLFLFLFFQSLNLSNPFRIKAYFFLCGIKTTYFDVLRKKYIFG